MEAPIRLVIADDHALFRQGLKSLLMLQPEVEIVAEVEKGGDIEDAVTRTSCDVLLLDLQMDRWTGDLVETLAARTRIVVLTASERIEDALAVMRKGAMAVVQKRFAIETLMEAVRMAAKGLVWMPPALQAELASDLRGASNHRLTERESEIARCVGEGLRNAEIARRLAISESTVKTHLNNIFQKLQVRDRMELAIRAARGRVTPAPDLQSASSK